MSKTVRRRGFTLPEVLVTITIVAVLAAVVVPAVLNQVSKGDTAGLAGDIQALRTAISNFTTDTRHYPRTIEDLINPIDDADLDLMGVAYGTAAQNAWKGPYFPTSQTVISTGTYSTSAFSLLIDSEFEAPSSTNNNFITLILNGTGLNTSVTAQIDRLFDGGDGVVNVEPNCSTQSAGAQAGNIRWTEEASSGTNPCNITVDTFKWRLVSAAQ